jgi:hypothetical protein
MHESRSRLFGTGLVLGLFCVLVGVLLILDNFGYISIGHVLHMWPVIVIAIGLARLLTRMSWGMRLEGAFWILSGCVLLASTLMLIPVGVWPLLLIFIGLLIIGHAVGASGRRRESVKDPGIPDRS